MTSDVSANPPYELVEGWEQLPQGYAHLDVADVAVDAADRVHLVTRMDPRVIVYDREGRFLVSWGEGVLSARPHAITIAPDGTIYCVDEGDHVVRHFTADGEPLDVIGIPGAESDTGHDGSISDFYDRVGSITRGGPPFNRPTKLAIGPNGDLYVSDGYGNSRIHHFSPSGELIRSWGEPGTGPGEFHVPHSVCVLEDGRVLVADRENERVQVFTADGEFVEQWADMQRPSAIAVDPEGLIYVTELAWRAGERSWVHGPLDRARPARLCVLDGRGRILGRWSSEGEGCDPGNLLAPHGMSVDSQGDIYVAEVSHTFNEGRGVVDHECHAFQKFARTRRI